MSENQQPLDEEQAVSDVQEQETLPAAAEDTLPAAQDENAPAILDAEPEEEEEDIDPADVKIFGMKRHVFQLTCLGAAVGYILCGLVGILGEAGYLSGSPLFPRVFSSYPISCMMRIKSRSVVDARIARSISARIMLRYVGLPFFSADHCA